MTLDNNTKQRGVVLVLVAIGMVSLLGMVGMALDLGHGYLNKSRLQYALDATALSSAKTLLDTDRDIIKADAHARDTFNEHLQGELAGDPMTLVVEFSDTLNPFVPGGTTPNYVRVRVNDFEMPYTLSRVLPGIGAEMSIGASAVAGIERLGGGNTVCDIAPLTLCGDPADTPTYNEDGEVDGNTLYGIPFDDGTGSSGKICLKSSESTGGQGDTGGGSFDTSDCVTADTDDEVGPGNFQLIELECEQGGGGSCVRQSLAGSQSSCLASSDTITTEPGNTVGPVHQGFNTRFGVYAGGGTTIEEYPPDHVVTEDLSYNDYTGRYDNPGSFDYPAPVGVPQRRVMAVPIGNCAEATKDGAGKSEMPVLELGCFFMTDMAGKTGQTNWIKGVLVRSCSASGEPATGPDSGGGYKGGPARIVLFKDPDSLAS